MRILHQPEGVQGWTYHPGTRPCEKQSDPGIMFHISTEVKSRTGVLTQTQDAKGLEWFGPG